MKKDYGKMIKDSVRGLKGYTKYIIIELIFVGLVIAADLLTKEFLYGHVHENGDIILIKGVLRFTAVENTGASFGMFGGNTLALAVVSLISSLIILLMMIFTSKTRMPVLRASLVLILAGAIGNMIDRFALDYVRDFIYFELIDFAVFNLADSALTVGTILLVIYVIFFYKEKPKEEKASEGSVEAAIENEATAEVLHTESVAERQAAEGGIESNSIDISDTDDTE